MSVRERQGKVEKLGLFARVNLVGDAPVFRRALSKIASFTEIDATVLIAGESGTGKELAGRFITTARDAITRLFPSIARRSQRH
jgi:transcriptional regulator with PAS, ATPase and Fis domain